MADKGGDKKKTDAKPSASKAKSSKKGDKKVEEKKIEVVPSKNFDLQKYASRYEGHTRYARLRFIAERTPSLQTEAYKLALEELKKGRNTTHYRQVAEKIGGRVDMSWADALDKQRNGQLEDLEASLADAKQNQQRTKIRDLHNKIGDFLLEGGDFPGALRSYMRTQEHSLTPETTAELCFNVVRTGVTMKNFVHVGTFGEQVDTNSVIQANPNSVAELRCALGLSHLNSRKYKDAAGQFKQANFEAVANLTKLISTEDVTLYTGLCALAEYSRTEMKYLLEDSNFRALSESFPVVFQMLSDFYKSNYASCLSALESLKNDLQLDYYLHDHVASLYEKIRNKALKEYFSPYESVDLQKMATAFQTTVPDLERELAKLINSNHILARIDSFNRRLVARQVTTRTMAFDRTVESGENFQTNSRALLLRVNLTRNNFLVKPPQRGAGGMGGMPGMMMMPGMGGMGMPQMMMGMGGARR